MLRVTALYRYPVKSCRGIAVTSAGVDARGFAGDRRFWWSTPTGVSSPSAPIRGWR